MTRMLRVALSIVCAAIAGVALAPGTALASYEVHTCGPEATPGLWTQVNTAPAGYASGSLCGGPESGPVGGDKQGSMYAEDILSSPANIPNGSRAGWTLTAPAGATITRISYYRTLASYIDSDQAAGLFLANGAPLEQCRKSTAFGSPLSCSMPNNRIPVVFANLNTPSLFFGVLCDLVTQGAIACSTGGTIHRVQAYMYSARVTISEDTAPTVTNVGGALWGAGVVSGSVPVTFSASDASGIREQAVQTLGRTIASTLQGCDFTSLQPPCAQSPNATLNVDSTRVADGTQTFQLVVTDAAGNSQIVTSPPVTVDNYGPPPPSGLTATARAGSKAIALTWSNPSNAPQPVNAAMAQLCSTSCSAPVSVNAFGAAQLTAPGPGAYSARVWLLDTSGRGGPHNTAATTVTVPSTSSPPPAPGPGLMKTKISALLHGRRLRVSGRVAASGRVTVSWRSKLHGKTVGRGSRIVTIRNQRLRLTFAVARGARTRSATIRVAVRSARGMLAQARARRG